MVERTQGSHHKGGIDEDGQAYHDLCWDRYRQKEARCGARGQPRAVAGGEHVGRPRGVAGMAATAPRQTCRDRSQRFVVVVFQPAQVRAYAKFHLQRAKNDKIDAALIAACTAAVRKIHAAPDPRLLPFAEQLTMIDQINEDTARLKNRIESCRNARIKKLWNEDIARLEKREKAELKALVASIRKHPDLAKRLGLINSVHGIGLPTAVAILVRLPEIGQITREQAVALAGLAPYDDDSGEQVGVRHIEGGRKRLRRALYTASLAASFRWNQQLIQLYQRLTAAGKEHKRALVACARKMLIFANTVVARGKPWQDCPPEKAALTTA